MITEISSSSSIGQCSVQESVDAALDAIVKHYRDPVHVVGALPESLSHITSESSASAPTSGPPVVQHWADRLTTATAPNGSSSSSLDGTAEYLFAGYSRWIRPELFRQRHSTASTASTDNITLAPTGIPVLQHYQLLLSVVLEKRATTKTTSNTVAPQQQQQQQATIISALLEQPFQEIASDISLLTKLAVTADQTIAANEGTENKTANTNKKDGPLHATIVNIVLPTMIGLLTNGIDILFNLGSVSMESSPTTNKLELKEALQKCTVVMLAFGHPRMILDPRNVLRAPLPTLTTDDNTSSSSFLTLVQEDPSFLYAPVIRNGSPQLPPPRLLDLGEHLSDESFWAQIQLDGTPWQDQEVGIVITSRAVDRFWQQLSEYTKTMRSSRSAFHHAGSAIVVVASEGTESETASCDDAPTNNSQALRQTRQNCLQSLSGENRSDLAAAVRAHFFGRDGTDLPKEDRLVAQSTTNAITTRLHLGRTVIIPKDEVDPINKSMNKAFTDIPSRVHVALHYIFLLQHDDILKSSNGKDGNAILEELLPVLYELLSAHEKPYVALGSAALIHLLSLMALAQNTTTSSNEAPLAKYIGSLLPVLNLACRTCREGAPLLLLARAQSMVCQMTGLLGTAKLDDTLLKHRRTTTTFFLTILDKHSHEVSDPDNLLWSLLVGGIIPLLHQHITDETASASVDAMEIGRLALTALLPILRYSSGWSLDTSDDNDSSNNNNSRKLLAPSILALVYALQAAYPIMPRHGGKIMSELLALLGNLQRQNLSTATDLALFNLTKAAGGVALAICGDRAAQVLDSVVSPEKGEGAFEIGIVELVEDIRDCAVTWSKAQQQQEQRLIEIERKSESARAVL